MCPPGQIGLSRPSQKKNPQYPKFEVAASFDIAATRIYFERFIRCICNLSILNNVANLKN